MRAVRRLLYSDDGRNGMADYYFDIRVRATGPERDDLGDLEDVIMSSLEDNDVFLHDESRYALTVKKTIPYDSEPRHALN